MDIEGLLFAFLIPFTAITFPIWIVWIVMHYRSKNREKTGLSEDEARQLRELSEVAGNMAERIKTLESILDAENPQWREYHGEK